MKKSTKAEVYLAAVRSDFKVFLQHAFKTINPGTHFLDNWHIEAIIHCLEEGWRGQMPRLVINLPPRHLKSFIATIAWPAFLLGRDPSIKIISVSYSDDLTRALSRDFRRIVESDWYRTIFSNVIPTKVTENEVITDKGGGRYATSVNGTLTGRGADLIIIDDPLKPDDSLSDKTREGVNEWYRSTLLSRLDDKRRSALILVMQRVHVNDLTGYVEAERRFHKLSLPAIARQDEQVPLGDGRMYLRRAGEPLHAERDSIETLEQIKRDVGPAIFNAQYQQAPEAPDGGLFKRNYFKIVDRQPPGLRRGALFVSIDSALSVSNTADYTAISLVVGFEGKFYVLKAERGRWDFDELKAKAWEYVRRHGTPQWPVHFVIESAGSGISLITHLRNAIGAGDDRLLCFDYVPRGEKMVRAARTLPFFEEGRVVIVSEPGRNAWVETYINEFLSFPNGRFDDQVDSLVQLLHSRRSLCLAEVPLY